MLRLYTTLFLNDQENEYVIFRAFLSEQFWEHIIQICEQAKLKRILYA
jgi:hypothetical protein